jgi:hypothetical protein
MEFEPSHHAARGSNDFAAEEPAAVGNVAVRRHNTKMGHAAVAPGPELCDAPLVRRPVGLPGANAAFVLGESVKRSKDGKSAKTSFAHKEKGPAKSTHE